MGRSDEDVQSSSEDKHFVNSKIEKERQSDFERFTGAGCSDSNPWFCLFLDV